MQTNTTENETSLNLNNNHYELRKYKILEILNQLPTDRNKLLKKNLPIALKINRQTFSNWLNASITDKIEIPSIKLYTIAFYLNTDIQKLINIPINPPPILTEIEKKNENILSKTGLTK